MKRRQFLGFVAAGGAMGVYGDDPKGKGDLSPRRIEITARKFEFTPAEIALKRGEAVVLAVTAEDFVHGFAIPDFGVRRDVIPGKGMEVAFTPDRAGRFHFLCDNFCGDGHDRMSGILVVTG